MQIILYAIPGFIALILIEWTYGLARGRNTYRLADTITSISLGSISRLRNLVFLGFGAWFYEKASDGYHLLDLPSSGWAIWIFALIAYDFSYYWFHRISHEVNFFWAAHVVHHQSEDYNLGTALRQSGSGLIGFIFYLPWLVVGIPAEILFASGAINLVYQFWVHTEHVGRLGPFEKVLITPSNHRVHHAQNAIYIDRNYGGMLCIWDRIFGSFQDELVEVPCIFGIRKPLHSYNPVWANVHVYWSTLQDAWHAKDWRDKFRVWIKGPGWRPPDVEEAYPAKPCDLEHFSKYQPQVPKTWALYAFVQFILVTLASTGLLVMATDLSKTMLYAAAILLVFSYFNMSRFTEGRPVALALEWARLMLVLAAASLWRDQSQLSMALFGYALLSGLWLLRLRGQLPDQAVQTQQTHSP